MLLKNLSGSDTNFLSSAQYKIISLFQSFTANSTDLNSILDNNSVSTEDSKIDINSLGSCFSALKFFSNQDFGQELEAEFTKILSLANDVTICHLIGTQHYLSCSLVPFIDKMIAGYESQSSGQHKAIELCLHAIVKCCTKSKDAIDDLHSALGSSFVLNLARIMSTNGESSRVSNMCLVIIYFLAFGKSIHGDVSCAGSEFTMDTSVKSV